MKQDVKKLQGSDGLIGDIIVMGGTGMRDFDGI